MCSNSETAEWSTTSGVGLYWYELRDEGNAGHVRSLKTFAVILRAGSYDSNEAHTFYINKSYAQKVGFVTDYVLAS